MILLVCGGRDYTDYQKLDEAISKLERPDIIVEGGAKGADRLARFWAVRNNVHYATVPALWDNFGTRAGGLRNTAMLFLRPDFCLAMPGGYGTEDMVQKCMDAGIEGKRIWT